MELATAAAMGVSACGGPIAAGRQSKFRKVPAVLLFVFAWTVALDVPASDMSRLPQDVEADLAAEREHTIRLGGLLGVERERNAQLTAQLQDVGAELAAERERGAQLTAQLQGVGAELAAERERGAQLTAQLQGVGAELAAERRRSAPLAAQLQGVSAELAAERRRNAPLAAQLQGVSAELAAERERCAHAVPRKD